jgi:alkylhydroperoxidase family enzyme
VEASGDEAMVKAALADWRTASLDARLRGALAFLEKLTLMPREIGRSDVAAARAAGLSDRALREAIYVCFLLSTMDRLADAFDFPLLDARALHRAAWIDARFGGLFSILAR